MDLAPANTSDLGDLVARQMDRLTTAMWIYDFDARRVLWANAAALRVWGADSLEELRARDLGADMSETVRARLAQYRKDLADPSYSVNESWTLYPDGRPQHLNMAIHGVTLPDGRLAMLCEGTSDTQRVPSTVRSAEALLHTPVAISLHRDTGDVLYQNPAAREAYDPNQPFGARFVDPELADSLIRDLSVGEDIRRVARMQTSYGKRWHEIILQKRIDAVDGGIVLLASETDVTEMKEAEERAEAGERAKTEFLAVMSHEIRTPLNGVLGTAELLADTPLDLQQSEFVSTITTCGSSLLAIINDILDLSKLRAGQMRIQAHSFDMAEVIDNVGALMAARAVEKSLDFTLRVDPQMPTELRGDAVRLQQIVLNLVSNAIKFTEAGAVRVDVSGHHCAERGSWCMTCAVTDTGCGIPATDLDRVFDEFAQVDGSYKRAQDGTGLGLAICATLVRLMGGTLSVDSRLGAGSTFSFKVPLEPMAEAPAPSAPLQGRRVFVADPDPTRREILTERLEAWGMRCVTQLDGEIPTDSCDFAVVDEACLPDVAAKADLPVVALVSVNSVIAAPSGEPDQAAVRLMKPLRPKQLHRALLQILYPPVRLAADSASPARAVDSAKPTLPRVSSCSLAEPKEGQDQVDVLICDDNLTNQRLLVAIIKKHQYRYAVASNGVEALTCYQRLKPKVILMDVSMPVMDGLEATRKIRAVEQSGQGPKAKIIAVTAHVNEGERARFLAGGMDDYLAKPYRPRDVLERIAALVACQCEVCRG